MKKGNVELIHRDERNRGKWNIGIVERLIPGKDGIVRALQLRARKSYFEQAVQHLYPLELTCDRDRDDKDSNIQADVPNTEERPKRSAAAISDLLTKMQMENEDSMPVVE